MFVVLTHYSCFREVAIFMLKNKANVSLAVQFTFIKVSVEALVTII